METPGCTSSKMQSLLISLFAVVAALQNVNYSAAKLAPKHSPKSSEMLSNNLQTYAYGNHNFENDLSGYTHALEALAHAGSELEGDYKEDDKEEAWLTEEHFNVNEVDSGRPKISGNNSNNNNNNNSSSSNKTYKMTATRQKQTNTLPADQHLANSREQPTQQHKLNYSKATGANESGKAVKAVGNKTSTTAITIRKNLTTSNAVGGGAGDAAATPQTKLYRPSGFVNPFGQLVAFFGSDQLHLQDYNFLFNAERHTVFQLHTSMPTASVNAASNGGVLNVVSDSIGAVFGVNTPASSAAGGAVPNVKVEEVQLYNAPSLRQSRFNPFNPTRILIHGWFGGAHAGIYQTLVPEYLKLNAGNYNVFTVDWGRGAIADYLTASYRVKPVGKVVAKFIDFLQREAGMSCDQLHVVGFSMGAHIAGIAGKFVQSGRLPVIYALDPALPFFRYENIDERVAITDADYVEVIHTSVGSYGYDRPLGHVDFYANWGSAQPGCFFNECSHFRAFQLFAETLHTKEAFRAQGCDVKLWQDMIKHRRCLMGTGRELTVGGDPANVTALRARGGVYYFATNANAPFGKAPT